MLRLEDDRKRELTFAKPPVRVVSLVPSDTENVVRLGCAAVLVGRTDYCELEASVPSVGGTKNPRVDDILALAPDLVIANQEENTKRDLERLAQASVRVYVGFPKRVVHGVAHLAKLARILGVERDPRVRDLIREGYDVVKRGEARAAERPGIATFCPIWKDPWMTVHGDTFVSDALRLAGARNVFADRERRYPLAKDLGTTAAKLSAEELDTDMGSRDTRYPRVPWLEIANGVPELVLLPDEPYAFGDDDVRAMFEASLPASRLGNVFRVRGKDLTWYGAQSLRGIDAIAEVVERARANARS